MQISRLVGLVFVGWCVLMCPTNVHIMFVFQPTQPACLFAQSSYIISPVCCIWLHKLSCWASLNIWKMLPTQSNKPVLCSQYARHIFLLIFCRDSSSDSNPSADYWNFSAPKPSPTVFDLSTCKMVPLFSFHRYSLVL